MSMHATVTTVLLQVLDLEDVELSRDTRLEVLPGWDSVNMLRTMMLLERELSTSFDVESFVKVATIGDLNHLAAHEPVGGSR